jgi:hypothetical protein
MRRRFRYLILIPICAAPLGCVDGAVSDSASSPSEAAVPVALARSTRARSPAAITRAHSPAPMLMPRRATANAPTTVASPIPTEFPSQQLVYTPVVTVGPSNPPDGPKLPLGQEGR